MRALVIDELRLQNFRAFPRARLRLSDLTILVGKNGAGKSSLLRACDLLRDAVTDSLPSAIELQGGLYGVCHRGAHRNLPSASSASSPTHFLAGDLGLALVLRRPLEGLDEARTDARVLYGFRLQVREDEAAPAVLLEEVLRCAPELGPSFVRSQGSFTSSLPGLAPSPPPDSLLLPLLAGMHPLWQAVLDTLRGLRTYDLSPSAIGAEQPIEAPRPLAKDGRNAASILHRLFPRLPSGVARKTQYDWLLKHLGRVLPGLTGVSSVRLSDSGNRLIHFSQHGAGEQRQVLRNGQVSQGTLRALGILLALLQEPAPALVFIDELEDSLHVDALAALVDAAEASTARSQIVFSSHSPELLGHPAVTAERLRILDWRAGESQVYLPSAEVHGLLGPPSRETVGSLLSAHALWHEKQPQSYAGDLLALDERT